MPTLYTNISPENSAYLNQLCATSRMSKAAVTDLILTAARESGWEVRPGDAPAIVVPGRPSPPAGPVTPEEGNDHE